MTAILSALLGAIDFFIQTHPNTTVLVVTGEVCISLIASHLPMPTPGGSKLYHGLFVVMTGLALNPARAQIGLNILLHGVAGLPVVANEAAAPQKSSSTT